LYASKSFHWNGVVSAAYSRSEAAQIFASSGYFDQGDLSYHQPLGKKSSLGLYAGEFRTIDASGDTHGKRFGGSVSYLLTPRLSFNAGYNYAHQTGTSSSFFLGTTNYVTIGVNWLLGASGN